MARTQPATLTTGTLLRSLRQAADLTQAALAISAGTSANHIARIERDERTPGLDLLIRLADSLGGALGRHVSLEEFRVTAE